MCAAALLAPACLVQEPNRPLTPAGRGRPQNARAAYVCPAARMEGRAPCADAAHPVAVGACARLEAGTSERGAPARGRACESAFGSAGVPPMVDTTASTCSICANALATSSGDMASPRTTIAIMPSISALPRGAARDERGSRERARAARCGAPNARGRCATRGWRQRSRAAPASQLAPDRRGGQTRGLTSINNFTRPCHKPPARCTTQPRQGQHCMAGGPAEAARARTAATRCAAAATPRRPCP